MRKTHKADLVQRRMSDGGYTEWRCLHCLGGFAIDSQPNYCPLCGEKVDYIKLHGKVVVA